MRTVILILLFLLLGCPAWADADADARRLSVRAAVLFNQAEKTDDPDRRIELLEEVRATLERMMRDFPETDAAVRLQRGEGIAMLTSAGQTRLTLESVIADLESAKLATGFISKGAFLVFEVDVGSAIAAKLEGIVDRVRSTLRRERIGYAGLGRQDNVIRFRLRDPAQIERARSLVHTLDAGLIISVAANGAFTLELDGRALANADHEAIEQYLEIIRRRSNELKVRLPVIQKLGSNGILLQIHIDDFDRRLVAALVKGTMLTILEERTVGPLDRNAALDIGGILIEIRMTDMADLRQLRLRLASLNVGEVSLQQFVDSTDFLIRVQRQLGGDNEQMKVFSAVMEVFPDDVVELRRVAIVGPNVAVRQKGKY